MTRLNRILKASKKNEFQTYVWLSFFCCYFPRAYNILWLAYFQLNATRRITTKNFITNSIYHIFNWLLKTSVTEAQTSILLALHSMWFISTRNTQHVHDTRNKKKTLQKWSTHIFSFILILMMFRRGQMKRYKNAKTTKKGNLYQKKRVKKPTK